MLFVGEYVVCVRDVNFVVFNFRGFGFITFTSSESVERAVAAGPHRIDDKVVCIDVADLHA